MAGKPISRAYEALIEKAGIVSILGRVADGETMGPISKSIGVSRWFLATYLNRDRYVAEALTLGRALAAHKRLAALPQHDGRSDVQAWVGASSERHLAALKAIRAEDAGNAGGKGSPALAKFLADLMLIGGETGKAGVFLS